VGEGSGAGADQIARVLAEVASALECKKAQAEPAAERLKELRATYQQLDVSLVTFTSHNMYTTGSVD